MFVSLSSTALGTKRDEDGFLVIETHTNSIQLRALAATLSCKGVSVREIARSLNKNSGWVSNRAQFQGNFSEKPRHGRPQGLDNAAKSLIEKTRYKRPNLARKMSKKFESKGLLGSSSTTVSLWRYLHDPESMETIKV